MGVVVFPQGNCFASLGLEEQLRIWDIKTHKMLDAIDVGRVLDSRHLATLPTGTQVIATNDEGLSVWDVQKKSRVVHLRERFLGAIAITSDGAFVACAHNDPGNPLPDPPSEVILWSTTDWREVARLSVPLPVSMCLAFSPSGRFLAVGPVFPAYDILVYDLSGVVPNRH
jgi:WD40 repeat protein